MANINPALCPICGSVNHCAEVAKQNGETPSEPCWCAETEFPPSIFAKVPDEAKNRACICENCVKGLALAKPV